MYENSFAERLAQLRIKKGVSARDMSLSIGQGESYISTIENKRAFPAMQAFFYICEYLEVTPKDFFDFEAKNPAQINAIVADLQKLEEHELGSVASLVNTLASKK